MNCCKSQVEDHRESKTTQYYKNYTTASGSIMSAMPSAI